MNREQVQAILEKLFDIVVSIDKDIAELNVSTAALTAALSAQMNPSDPEAGAKLIHELEQIARKADPSAAGRQRVGDLMQVAKLWRKYGGPHES